jgi:hypothetical protein
LHAGEGLLVVQGPSRGQDQQRRGQGSAGQSGAAARARGSSSGVEGFLVRFAPYSSHPRPAQFARSCSPALAEYWRNRVNANIPSNDVGGAAATPVRTTLTDGSIIRVGTLRYHEDRAMRDRQDEAKQLFGYIQYNYKLVKEHKHKREREFDFQVDDLDAAGQPCLSTVRVTVHADKEKWKVLRNGVGGRRSIHGFLR